MQIQLKLKLPLCKRSQASVKIAGNTENRMENLAEDPKKETFATSGKATTGMATKCVTTNKAGVDIRGEQLVEDEGASCL